MENKKRLLNIELLRIIAMILVLLAHSTWNAHYFNIDIVHTDLLKSIGVLEVYGWIFVCVPCFVVISGYFGMKWLSATLPVPFFLPLFIFCSFLRQLVALIS